VRRAALAGLRLLLPRFDHLTRFVGRAFSEKAAFDYERFGKSGRSLGTHARQRARRDGLAAEGAARGSDGEAPRRLGFTGLGDALIMLRPALRLGSRTPNGGEDLGIYARLPPYRASGELAKERGAFPLFNADLYLSGSSFAARLPRSSRRKIRKNGIRNSHLLSIAPTGTISLACRQCFERHRPPFSWIYTRKKRMADGR